MNNGWLYLATTILCGMLSLPLSKHAQGFQHLGYGAAAMCVSACMYASWIMVIQRLPVSTAYPIWIGIEATAVLLMSYFLFHESFSPLKIFYIAMVLVGCAGLIVMESKGNS
jgi:multidrug transporter EmrE-like cation transporter